MKSFAADLDALLTVAAAVLDADGVLLEANAGFLRLLPAAIATPIGAKISRFFIQPNFAALRASMNDTPSAGYRGLLTIGDRNGTTRTLLGRTWRCDDGIQMLAEYDIVELERFADEMLDLNRESSLAQNALIRESVTMKQRERWILEASLTDALTGLGNRRRLDQALATEISRTRRAGGLLSALMLDIDHFKCINDTYGHSVGDTVLARVGALLRSHTRPTDIVTRFGGEEFVVLMPDAGLAQAAVKAELLRTMLAAEMMGPISHLH